jgi:hypothetical protein
MSTIGCFYILYVKLKPIFHNDHTVFFYFSKNPKLESYYPKLHWYIKNIIMVIFTFYISTSSHDFSGFSKLLFFNEKMKQNQKKELNLN